MGYSTYLSGSIISHFYFKSIKIQTIMQRNIIIIADTRTVYGKIINKVFNDVFVEQKWRFCGNNGELQNQIQTGNTIQLIDFDNTMLSTNELSPFNDTFEQPRIELLPNLLQNIQYAISAGCLFDIDTVKAPVNDNTRFISYIENFDELADINDSGVFPLNLEVFHHPNFDTIMLAIYECFELYFEASLDIAQQYFANYFNNTRSKINQIYKDFNYVSNYYSNNNRLDINTWNVYNRILQSLDYDYLELDEYRYPYDNTKIVQSCKNAIIKFIPNINNPTAGVVMVFIDTDYQIIDELYIIELIGKNLQNLVPDWNDIEVESVIVVNHRLHVDSITKETSVNLTSHELVFNNRAINKYSVQENIDMFNLLMETEYIIPDETKQLPSSNNVQYFNTNALNFYTKLLS